MYVDVRCSDGIWNSGRIEQVITPAKSKSKSKSTGEQRMMFQVVIRYNGWPETWNETLDWDYDYTRMWPIRIVPQFSYTRCVKAFAKVFSLGGNKNSSSSSSSSHNNSKKRDSSGGLLHKQQQSSSFWPVIVNFRMPDPTWYPSAAYRKACGGPKDEKDTFIPAYIDGSTFSEFDVATGMLKSEPKAFVQPYNSKVLVKKHKCSLVDGGIWLPLPLILPFDLSKELNNPHEGFMDALIKACDDTKIAGLCPYNPCVERSSLLHDKYRILPSTLALPKSYNKKQWRYDGCLGGEPLRYYRSIIDKIRVDPFLTTGEVLMGTFKQKKDANASKSLFKVIGFVCLHLLLFHYTHNTEFSF